MTWSKRLLGATVLALGLLGCDRAAPPAAARPVPQKPAQLKASRARPATPAVRKPVRDDASLAVLREALASKDYETRLIAVETIGGARLVEGSDWLGQALGDPEHDVRMMAVDGLGKLRTPRAFELLRSVRDDATEDLDIRAVAAAGLLTNGQGKEEQ